MAAVIVALRISIVIFAALFCIVDSARCRRTGDKEIVCRNVRRDVIKRLPVYYNDDVSLMINNSSIPTLENGFFDHLDSLEKLSMTNCGIRIIELDVFRGLKLTHLKLEGNHLSHISPSLFNELTELEFLDLSKNFISQIEIRGTEQSLTNLKYIDLSDNMLRDLNFVGNFPELETVNFENNSALREVHLDSVLHFPKIKEIFFRGNSFNRTYNEFVRHVLKSAGINIDSKHPINYVEWNYVRAENSAKKYLKNNTENANTIPYESRRLMNDEIGKEFKLSPEQIKSLNSSQLHDLASKILMLRNFTIHERKMLELDRKRIEEESRSIKNEVNRVEQIKKRVNEIIGKAEEESRAEYIEKNCHDIPNETWWDSFKRWNCKNLYNLIGKIVHRKK